MKQKYTLVKRELVKEKTFRVIIVADSNDADYITEDTTYTEQEFNDSVNILIDLIKNHSGRHEFENFRNETEEGYIEVPYCEYGSCHTLKSIEITCEDVDGIIYNVELIDDEGKLIPIRN